jgi:hypothetical protein
MPSANESERETSESENDRNHRMVAKWTRRVGQFTLLLVIATGFSDFFIWKQLKVATSQAEDTREQLKAYVSPPTIIGIAQTDRNGTPLIYGFFPEFENSGGTRTANMTAWASIHYFSGEVPNSQDTSKPYKAIPKISEFTIGGNSKTQIGPITITPDEAAHSLSKEGVVLLWGAAVYSNVFEPAKKHHITFCYVMVPGTDAAGRTGFQQQPYKDECNASD